MFAIKQLFRSLALAFAGPAAALALAISLRAAPAHAQAPSTSASKTLPEPEAQRSPREALRRFLELSDAARYTEAATLLDVPKERSADGPLLARRLRAVLDRDVNLDLDGVSDKPEGKLDDGLSPGLEQVGTLRVAAGASDPIRMSRLSDGSGWRFSRATVSKVDGWYAGLPDRWFIEHLPAPLLRPGPRDVLWWQWLGLLSTAVFSLLLGSIAGRITRGVLTRAAKHTQNQWDDRVLSRLRGPMTLAFALAFARSLEPLLLLYPKAEAFMHQALHGIFLADLCWGVWRLVDVTAAVALDSTWSKDHVASRALIPLGRRAGKALVGIAAALLFLSALGYSITSLVAGLGIGGLAFALASQKTVENLFGAFSLAIDQPFREGDFVRIGDMVGTVEVLGLRSTRVRTLDRTLVTIPNGKLAEMTLETFAARDRLRLACTLGVEYGTSVASMRTVLEGLERVLREHPKIWPDAVVVRFKEFAASSLDIDIMAWFQTSDWGEFILIRQEVLLAFMEVVEGNGCSFAFPTQTVHLAKDAAAPPRAS